MAETILPVGKIGRVTEGAALVGCIGEAHQQGEPRALIQKGHR